MPNNFEMRDAALRVAMPLGEDDSEVQSDPIDLELTSRSDFVAHCEVLVTAPALATGELGDTNTMTYAIEHSDTEDFALHEVLFPQVLVQTGAGGAGAAAATKRVRLPSNVKRYIRLTAINSANLDASAKSATLELVF